jgi:hypothetical protein
VGLVAAGPGDGDTGFSLSSITVTVIRSMTQRMICLRSASVVVAACHSAGMSPDSARIASRSAADRVTGRVRVNRS